MTSTVGKANALLHKNQPLGNCCNNAVAKSCFSSFKKEKSDVFDYIESF
jgi:hypothetical protein